MFKFTIAILCFIMAAAAIDGPTCQEGDNFLLAFTLLFIGIAIGVQSVIFSDRNN